VITVAIEMLTQHFDQEISNQSVTWKKYSRTAKWYKNKLQMAKESSKLVTAGSDHGSK
jgi:hypothetical protein